MAGWSSTDGAILSLGAQWIEEERAYNFSLGSRHAESVTLLLFGEDDTSVPLIEHRLDPRVNKTWHIWHCRLRDHELRGARYYAYRIDEPRPSGPLTTGRLKRYIDELSVTGLTSNPSGIERRIAAGLDPSVASVASLFVSRWHTAVMGKLPESLNDMKQSLLGRLRAADHETRDFGAAKLDPDDNYPHSGSHPSRSGEPARSQPFPGAGRHWSDDLVPR